MKRLVASLLLLLPLAAFAAPSDGECPPDPADSVATLLADLHPVLPEGCEAMDFKALGHDVRETKAIGMIGKIKLGLRAKGMIGDAKKYVKNPDDAALAKLRKTYDDLFGDFVKKLDNKDPALVAKMQCARAAGFDFMLAYAREENAKDAGTAVADSSGTERP